MALAKDRGVLLSDDCRCRMDGDANKARADDFKIMSRQSASWEWVVVVGDLLLLLLLLLLLASGNTTRGRRGIMDVCWCSLDVAVRTCARRAKSLATCGLLVDAEAVAVAVPVHKAASWMIA